MAPFSMRFEPAAEIQEYSRPSDWRRAFWTRRGHILLLFVAFGLAALVATDLVAPVYNAQAVLEILPERQPNAPANPMASAAADEVRLNTEAQKVGAEPVVRTVFNAWQAGQFGPVQGYDGLIRGLIRNAMATIGEMAEERINHLCSSRRFGPIIEQYICVQSSNVNRVDEEKFSAFQSHLTVIAERDTRLIKVVFTAPDPEVAAKVANAVVSEYLNRDADQVLSQSGRYVSWLQGRISALGSQVAKSDEAVAQYRGQTGLIEMAKDSNPTRRSPTVEELEHALQDVSSAETDSLLSNIKLQALRQIRRDPNKIQSATELVGSKVIEDLAVQLSAEQARLAGLFLSYHADSPVVTKARAGIVAIHNQISQEIEKLLASAEQQYLTKINLLKVLNERVKKLKARVAEEEIELVTLHGLERQADTDSDLYSAYLRQARGAIEAVSWQPVAASVVASAIPPVEPMFPHSRLSLPLEIIGSFIAAAMIGILRELKRQQRVFSGPKDFAGVPGFRLIGTVPRIRNLSKESVPDSFKTSIENIAFRITGLRGSRVSGPHDISRTSAISDQSGSAGAAKSFAIAVTSAVPAEGKSMLSAALAKQLRADGARVLLIDADIRRPGTVEQIQAAQHCPIRLVHCALDGTQWDEEGKDGLHVLQLADLEASPSAVLAALPQLVATLKQVYDVLVIDTPALLVVSDALAAIAACEEILFAVKWCSTSRDDVEFALQELSEAERGRTRILLTSAEGGAQGKSRTAGQQRLRSRVGVRVPFRKLA